MDHATFRLEVGLVPFRLCCEAVINCDMVAGLQVGVEAACLGEKATSGRKARRRAVVNLTKAVQPGLRLAAVAPPEGKRSPVAENYPPGLRQGAVRKNDLWPH